LRGRLFVEANSISSPMAAKIVGVDVFCGAGGLSYGLRKAGISIAAGIDLDPDSEFPFIRNTQAQFIRADVRNLNAQDVSRLYPRDCIRLLAGCAPCRPFSPFRRGTDNSRDKEWSLLAEFCRLAIALKPEFVTMENVPGLASKAVFHDFVSKLTSAGYHVNWKSVYCPRFGIPQHRRRLVLIASLVGPVNVPTGHLSRKEFRTVRDTISSLPRLVAGAKDGTDRLHRARHLDKINLERLRSSKPGGTWHDWPKELRAKCHRKRSGRSYRSVYSRMVWDEPAPTITTQFYNFGTGRFGHPEQHRSITLREAALLQSFPRRFRFVPPYKPVYFTRVGRLIGNAVPPRLAYFIGKQIARAASAAKSSKPASP
jgi:DNA (cytosine-5)-methyltransferase 1